MGALNTRRATAAVTAAVLACLGGVTAYTCDLAASTTKPFASGAFPTAGLSPAQILAAAATYGSGSALQATSYAYTCVSDGAAMRFDTDCSCWLDYFTLESPVAASLLYPAHNPFLPSAYAAVTKDRTVTPPVPRAANWTTYFAGLGADAPWAPVKDLRTVQAGDVIAYKLPPGSTDTGHVMVALNNAATGGQSPVSPSDNPYPSDYTAAFWVFVADASSVKHQNDTRCASGCKFKSGVGTGALRLFVNSAYAPVAFEFSATAGLHTAQFAMGRAVSM